MAVALEQRAIDGPAVVFPGGNIVACIKDGLEREIVQRRGRASLQDNHAMVVIVPVRGCDIDEPLSINVVQLWSPDFAAEFTAKGTAPHFALLPAEIKS